MLRFTLLLLFNCIFFTVFAQKSSSFYTNYTTDQGLPSTETYAVSQDKEGYLWFATDNGVCRFNGFEFKQFGPLQGLEDPVVFYIEIAEDGKVWFCSMSGKLFYYEKGEIFPYKHNKIISEFRQKNGLPSCFNITQNEVYIGLNGLGILKIADNGTYRITRKNEGQGLIFLDLGRKILNSNYQNATIKTRKSNISIIQNKQEFYFEKNIDKKGSGPAKSLRLNKDTLLLQSDYQWFIFDEKKLIWEKEVPETFTSIIQIGKKFYACPSSAKGIWVFDNLEDLKNMRHETYLDGIQTSGILQDKNGAFWITTIDKGVFYFPSFENKVLDENVGFSTAYITTFAQKDNKNAFVGLRNGDVFLYNFKKNTTKKIYNNTLQQKVYELYYDTKTDILWKGAAMQIEYLENGKWEKSKFLGNNAYKLKSIHQDKEILGIYQGGFFILDKKTKDSTFFTEYRKNIPRIRTLAALGTPDNRLWIGNVNGLFEIINGELLSPNFSHPTFKKRIEDLAILSDGSMVIATKGGGVSLWKDADIQTITSKDGLSTDMIENLYVDENDNIWAGTLNGLNRIKIQKDRSVQIQTINTTYGLPSNEITKVSKINGKLWVATTKGLAILNDKELDFQGESNLIIEEVRVNGKPILDDENNIFPYNQNNIQIKYVDLNYRNAGNTLYRFRLKNQNEWTVSNDHGLNFSTLENGTYTFEVQVKTAIGAWSKSKIWQFEILPPWWKTDWFRALLISLIVGIVVMGFIFYIKRLNRDVANKKELAQLQNTAMQAQMNPHFIFNCLNSIQLLIVLDKKTEAMDYLGTFSKLVRRVLQVSAQDKISLSEDIDLIESYLHLEKMRFKENFEYRIEKSNASEFDLVKIPPLLVQPYVENAIIHGIGKNNKHSMFQFSKNITFLKNLKNNILIYSKISIFYFYKNHKKL